MCTWKSAKNKLVIICQRRSNDRVWSELNNYIFFLLTPVIKIIICKQHKLLLDNFLPYPQVPILLCLWTRALDPTFLFAVFIWVNCKVQASIKVIILSLIHSLLWFMLWLGPLTLLVSYSPSLKTKHQSLK